MMMRLLSPILLAWLWWRGRKHASYGRSNLRRLGFYGDEQPQPMGTRIWIHAVSVGETLAVAPLIRQLIDADYRVLATSTTPTGAEQLMRQFGDRIEADWSPIDTPGAVCRFLNHWHPNAGLLVETEIWPNAVTLASSRGIPMFIVNARMSARSARVYAKFSRLMRPSLECLAGVAAQERADARRLICLGVPRERIEVTGNLKFAADKASLEIAWKHEIQYLGTELNDRLVWLAASTHDGEEVLILQAFAALKAKCPDALLILAPRHPVRTPKLSAIEEIQRWKVVLYSQLSQIAADDDILILDTLGRLGALTACADLVFVGGSLIERGGHNPLEAAAWGIPIIAGPHVHNFRRIYRQLYHANAAIEVHPGDLGERVLGLLGTDSARSDSAEIGARARAYHLENSGSLERHWDFLQPKLP